MRITEEGFNTGIAITVEEFTNRVRELQIEDYVEIAQDKIYDVPSLLDGLTDEEVNELIKQLEL